MLSLIQPELLSLALGFILLMAGMLAGASKRDPWAHEVTPRE